VTGSMQATPNIQFRLLTFPFHRPSVTKTETKSTATTLDLVHNEVYSWSAYFSRLMYKHRNSPQFPQRPQYPHAPITFFESSSLFNNPRPRICPAVGGSFLSPMASAFLYAACRA
jgi:hypothetical protein